VTPRLFILFDFLLACVLIAGVSIGAAEILVWLAAP